MTQEEEQLLLIDLCTRLPYHPRINVCNDSWEGCQIGEFDTNLYSHHIDAFVCGRIEVKPYLRSMSDMTEEEEEKWAKASNMKFDMEDGFIDAYDAYLSTDWLNAHHFDYRGLIDKGLALEAKSEMYKNE